MLHSDAIFQLFIFVILFVVIRIVIHPILVKRKTYRIFINQICTFIGREAVVTKTITCNEYGIINFAGISWNAITKEEELKEGEVVLITNKFETFLVVSKINTA
jgi:membrane protein implicated in regulation of membrane protease activity